MRAPGYCVEKIADILGMNGCPPMLRGKGLAKTLEKFIQCRRMEAKQWSPVATQEE